MCFHGPQAGQREEIPCGTIVQESGLASDIMEEVNGLGNPTKALPVTEMLVASFEVLVPNCPWTSVLPSQTSAFVFVYSWCSKSSRIAGSTTDRASVQDG